MLPRVGKNLHSSISSRGAHDPAAGMSGGAAHVQVVRPEFGTAPTRAGRRKNSCSSVNSPWKILPSGQSPLALEVERRDDLTMQNDVPEIRRVLGERVDDGVAELLALLVPDALRQMIGRVLHEARHDVLTRWRDAGIGERRDDDVDVGLPRKPSVLGRVVGALHVVDARGYRDGAAQVRAGARQRGELRKRIEREVDLAGRAAKLVATHIVEELVGKDGAAPRAAGTSAVGRRSRRRSVAVISSPFSSTTPRAALSERTMMRATRLATESRRPLRGRRGDGVGDGAGAPARQSPRPERAVDLTHVVVEQHVGRPRRAHAEKCSDDPRGGHRRLEDVGLEPLIQEIHGAHRHQLDLVVLVLAR